MDPINEMLRQELQAYFPEDQVDVRVGPTYGGPNEDGFGGKPLFYIPARRVQQRLDNVVGPLNWQVSYSEPVNRHSDQKAGVEATISILDPFTGEWVSKADVSQNTAQDAMKGGYSKAVVRAGVQWGIGRYLYHMPDTGWEDVEDNYGTTQFVDEPEIPQQFTPSGSSSGSRFTQAQVRRLRNAAEGKDRGDVKEVWSEDKDFQTLLDEIRSL